MAGKRAMPALLMLLAAQAYAEIRVRDDAGDTVTLARPAQRVVALAPHATELLFAAGGAGHLVGAVAYSDYPPQASSIPRVGDNHRIDLEKLLALKPDLLVVWRHDAASPQMEQLRALGIPVYYSDPRRLADVPRSVKQLGRLLGTEAEAQRAAAGMEQKIAALRARHAKQPTVRVFYQVWSTPLYTLNEGHIVSDALRVCGGENIFGKLRAAAPMLSQEAVLQEDPEAIVSADSRGQESSGIEIWKRFPRMLAVSRGNLFAISDDLMNRPGPRIIDGATELCERLEQARSRRPAGG